MLMGENRDVQQMGDGLRYIRKRKHKEISKSEEEEVIAKKEEEKSKGKKFKFSKNKENISDKSEVNSNINPQSKKEKIQNNIEANNINNNNLNLAAKVFQGNNNFNNVNDQKSSHAGYANGSNQLEMKGNLKNNLNPISNINQLMSVSEQQLIQCKGENQSKKVNQSEYDRMKGIVKKYEENFKGDYMTLLIKKLLSCLERNSKVIKGFKGKIVKIIIFTY